MPIQFTSGASASSAAQATSSIKTRETKKSSTKNNSPLKGIENAPYHTRSVTAEQLEEMRKPVQEQKAWGQLKDAPFELQLEFAKHLPSKHDIGALRLSSRAFDTAKLMESLIFAPSIDAIHELNQEVREDFQKRKYIHLPASITDQEFKTFIERGYLDNVKSLDLSGCSLLTDASFLLLAKFKQLKEVNFSNCIHLTDAGLAALKDHTQMKKLDFTGCRKISSQGFVHFKAMSNNLEELILNKCSQIDNNALLLLRSFQQLQGLELSRCRLIDDIGLSSIACLSELKILILDGCDQISDTGIEALEPLKKQLQQLSLRDCYRISNDAMTVIGEMLDLVLLNLSNCFEINNNGLQPLEKLVKLEQLSVCGLRFVTNEGLRPLRVLVRLQELNISDCPDLTDGVFEHMQNLASLLHLSAAKLNGINGSGLTHLKNSKLLSSIRMTFCRNLQNENLVHVKPFQQLKVLRVDGCPDLNDDGIVHLKDLRQIKIISVSVTGVGDKGISFLTGMNQLQELYISYAQNVTDKGMDEIAKIKQLQVFHMQALGNVSNKGFEKLGGLSELHTLDASFCEKISDKAMVILPKLQKLKILGLPYGLSDKSLPHIQPLSALEEISISRSFMTTRAVPVLTKLKYLKEILLTSPTITDTQLLPLLNNRNLKRLSFNSAANFTESTKNQFAAQGVELVNLEYNYSTGS